MGTIQIAGYEFDQSLFMEWAEKIFFALAIVVITWALAKAAKWAFAKMVDQISFLQRDTSSGESVGMALGRIVSLLVWLFGLLAVLQQLGFDSVITPVQGLLGNFIGYVDNIVFAGAIFFIGSMVARIVRDLVETALSTVNFDKWANRGGVEAVTGNSAISKTIGTIVYVLVIIPVAIAALQMLEISAITEPAMNLLNMVFKAIPLIIGACVLLGIGFVLSRWIAGLIRDLLPSLGADRAIDELGILPAGRSASGVIATMVTIAIMVFFAIAATDMLGFPQLTSILNTVLAQAGSVVFGAVLIAMGVLIANILRNLIADATDQGIASNITYWITIGLFVFIGLKQMAIGGPIVDYAFGAMAVGAAVAFALAFGLGGRDAAAQVLKDLRAAPAKPAAPKPVAPLAAKTVKRAPAAKTPVKKK
ncbi:MAG: mechanosensitive ion channel [Sphingorhabdus sp.]